MLGPFRAQKPAIWCYPQLQRSFKPLCQLCGQRGLLLIFDVWLGQTGSRGHLGNSSRFSGTA